MRYLKIAVIMLVFCSAQVFGQKPKLVSGPWAGNVELRTASVWAEVSDGVKSVGVSYSPSGKPFDAKTISFTGKLGNDFNPVKIDINGLDMNTSYDYVLLIDGKPVKSVFKTKFSTKDLWEYRKPAPDFAFLAGSCAYFNEPLYDRPGKPYGADSSIFETMATTPADFHIWMGDNWYTREVDYTSRWGLNYRASMDRSHKVLQAFMAAMPQYAIWDDHDYGPNDAGKSFLLKDDSRDIFKKYTLNPSYGEEGKGIYTKFSYGDVDFFLTDDRYFRSEIEIADSVEGAPNPGKTYFGKMQMEWLKNALLFSKATFKIIVTGGQVLNPLNKVESMSHYSYEYHELLDFLGEYGVPGVVFFTGDRHHSEVIKMERPGLPPLYDVTISPYTAGVSKASGIEKDNPFRVPNTLVEAQNFGKIAVSGKKNERKLSVSFIGVSGKREAEWSVSEKELQFPTK